MKDQTSGQLEKTASNRPGQHPQRSCGVGSVPRCPSGQASPALSACRLAKKTSTSALAMSLLALLKDVARTPPQTARVTLCPQGPQPTALDPCLRTHGLAQSSLMATLPGSGTCPHPQPVGVDF